MPDVQLTVRSRRIHTPDGWRDGVVVVDGGRIAGIVPAGDRPPAARHVEATDNVVMPGLVDTHAHLRDPGFTHKEDWTTGTRAAAAGGVTTVLDMPNVDPPTSDAGILAAHLANARAKSVVDFGHNAAATIPENIAGLAEAGATAFKVFMMSDVGRSYPHMPGIAVDDHATLFRICEEVARTGRPLFVHAWDQSLYELFVARAQAEWGRDFRSYARAGRMGEGIVWDAGIATMLGLQRATGVRLHVLHLMTIGGLELIRGAKAAGRAVTAEVNPHSLFVTSWANIERLGPYALHMWVPDHHAAALWDATVDGTIDVVGTDHAPHTREEKERGWTDMYATPGGSPSLQHFLSLLLSEVAAGRLSLDRVIELCATAPARLVDLYPRKGAIAPGSDADLVVVDLEREATITASHGFYSKCGWTNLEGRRVTGVPVMTVLRGRVIAEDGIVTAEPGTGEPVTPPRVHAGAG